MFAGVSGRRTREVSKWGEEINRYRDVGGGEVNGGRMCRKCVRCSFEIKLFYLVWFISFVCLRLPLFIWSSCHPVSVHAKTELRQTRMECLGSRAVQEAAEGFSDFLSLTLSLASSSLEWISSLSAPSSSRYRSSLKCTRLGAAECSSSKCIRSLSWQTADDEWKENKNRTATAFSTPKSH